MRLTGTVTGFCVVATVLSGCGGGSSGESSSGGTPEAEQVANGGTFTVASSADPGNLDPQLSASSNLLQLSAFAYDPLLGLDNSGKVLPALAQSWTLEGMRATLTLRDGITCADGSPFTAADAAANLTFVGDPANQSPFLGVYMPAGAKVSASGQTVTLNLAAPAPFLLEGLSGLPMVCASGMADRKVLAKETRGTGPFPLKEAVPSDHFTFTKRTGYTWGPDGASTDTAGLPDEIVVKIVANETTAANLLLSGGLNAAVVLGADAQRLQQANLFSAKQDTLLGEMWLNHATGRPGSDPAVRKALVQALDLPQVAKVLTSNQGVPGTTLSMSPPVACPGNTAAAAPAYDLEQAKATLDGAGWSPGAGGTRIKGGKPLKIVFNHNTVLGPGGTAAAELATAAWKQLGVEVDVQPQDQTASVDTLFKTGNWDVAWQPLNVSSPDQLVPFLSGPAVPKGNNFAHISNAAYDAAIADATTKTGSEGCEAWLSAEENLIRDADVVPFANRTAQTFGKQARFESGGVAVTPTSIRMLAS